MNVFVTGLHGFIGQGVKAAFERQGHQVYPVPREDLLLGGKGLDRITEQAEMIVNLAGTTVTGRWTEERMIDILESRRVSTRNLVDSVNRCSKRLQLFINASAVGIYQPDRFCDEESSDIGRHFLAKVANAWEEEAGKLRNVRKVVLRFGVVIAAGGGVLKKMMPWIRSRIAVVLGNGEQEFPVIHLEDITGFMIYLLGHPELEGVYNMVIPNCVNYREFVRALAGYKKPFLRFRVPAWVLQLMMGPASTAITRSAHVVPWRLMKSGYEYKCRTVGEVVEELKS
ncbi:MAG: TIGR01777 family oxidoreductase [Odoribacter sp.]|nr:TIGR01777 family oxidoreductase [Odoribacter sp.]